ncbi:hypothetical protein ACLI4R_01560 [Natrialbaceae archaeon A-chndr2]
MSWRCTWCGRVYSSDEEPHACTTCDSESFERVDPEREETVETGTQYVWVCPNCGREHVKNNPPCSRCLNPTLEQVEPSYEDVERDLDVPGWLEVAKPYLPIVAIVVVILALFATGIVPASVLPGIGPDVPGESDSSNDIEHAAVERAIHEALEAHRDANGFDSRTYESELAAFATEHNQRYVVAQYTDRDPGSPPDPANYASACQAEPAWAPLESFDGTIESYDDPERLGADIAAALLESPFGANVETGYTGEGIDLHVGPDGVIHVGYAAC